MATVARDIREWCGGTLDAVVATHRHKDHISGFGGSAGKIIARMDPKVVVQPWTEHPDLPVDARAPLREIPEAGERAFASSLSAQQRFTEGVMAELRRAAPRHTVSGELGFLGENKITNRSAVQQLMAMGHVGRAVYARAGSASGLDELLPGVKVHVLGPPTVDQWDQVTRQRHEDDTEFWHLMAHPGRSRPDSMRKLFPSATTSSRIPVEARWLSRRIDDLRKELILPIVRALDDAINNTSLILLFEVGTGDDRRLMLFPGDAQIENWAYSLTGPDAHQWADLFADVDLYKVGHHGSLNATPKDKPLEQIRQARAGRRSRADDAPLYARRRPRSSVAQH